MILTGDEIEREWRDGRIIIDPFIPEQVNPNSYNFRLGDTLRVYDDGILDVRTPNSFREVRIPPDGYVLEPGRLYLAHTIEVLGSDHYAPTFAARSSIARLGMFINLSASLGDIGYKGQWTLQLFTAQRVRIYPGTAIGQMMWWRPEGEIILYDGKYQGASGPRSSDIHVDFHKHLARQRLPGLRAGVDPAEVGPKFAALSVACRDFSVPAAFCVPADEFADAVTPEQATDLGDAFSDLQATVGAFYLENVARIQEIAATLRVPDGLRRLVTARLTELFGGEDDPVFAIRSSGLDEDTAGSSLAGIHDTVLGVRGIDAVVDAIEQCWCSYYAGPALAARLRAGDLSWRPRLAVIVQRQIDPLLAGVAFTGLERDDVVIEYVEGLADTLVSGITTPTKVTSSELAKTHYAAPVPHHDRLAEVAALAMSLRGRRGHEVDVEWAVDADGLHLIQVRPANATGGVITESSTPLLTGCPLYGGTVPEGFGLGDLAGVYGGYVAKRGPAYRMAIEGGVDVGKGSVIWANGLALADPATSSTLDGLLGGQAHECVLDVGSGLRQIVVPKHEVRERLTGMFGAEGKGVHAIIVREFIRGDLGVITRLVGDGLVVEFTREGLMALNRGTAGAVTLVLPDRSAPAHPVLPTAPADRRDAEALVPHLPTLTRFTEAMISRFGDVALEWVFARGRCWFVDYSLLGDDTVNVASDGSVLISRGTATGRVMHLSDDALLSRLSIGPAVSIGKATDVSQHEGLADIVAAVQAASEPPVIRASRPYAVLSVVLADVAGFVFDEGSTLGHLPILLREAGVPAVAATGVEGGDEVVISDGTVSIARRHTPA